MAVMWAGCTHRRPPKADVRDVESCLCYIMRNGYSADIEWALVHFRTLVTLRRVRVRVRVGLELRLGLVRVRIRLGLDLGLGLG